MSRCKCCNTKLFEEEMKQPDPLSEDGYRNICNRCNFLSSEFNYVYDHTHAFEDLEDGITPPKTSNY